VGDGTVGAFSLSERVRMMCVLSGSERGVGNPSPFCRSVEGIV